MTEQELDQWEKGEWDQEWWDKRMEKIRKERGSYPDALMFLRADAELARLHAKVGPITCQLSKDSNGRCLDPVECVHWWREGCVKEDGRCPT